MKARSFDTAKSLSVLAMVGLTVFAACRPSDKNTPNTQENPQNTNETLIIKANPNLPKLPFQNQDGNTVQLADLKGKPVLMTFIFTRCAVPTMCPLTTKRFAEVQQALSPEDRRKVTLVSVSFDPEYDTPKVLKEYGTAYGADFSNWQFWTGSKENIFELTNAYNMWYKEEGSDEYSHRMISVLLKPDGSFAQEFRGAGWEAKEVAKELTALIEKKKSGWNLLGFLGSRG